MSKVAEKTKRKSQFYEDLMREKGKIIYHLVKEHKYTWQTIADMKNDDIRKIYKDMPNTIQKSITNYYNLCYDMIKESTFVFYSLHGRTQSTPQAIRTYMKRYCKKFHRPFPEEVRVNDNIRFTPSNFLDMNKHFFDEVKVMQLDNRKSSPKVDKEELLNKKMNVDKLVNTAVSENPSVAIAQKELVIELSALTKHKVQDILEMKIEDIQNIFDKLSDKGKAMVSIVLGEFTVHNMNYTRDTNFFVTFGSRYGEPHKIQRNSLSMFFSYAYEKYGYVRKNNQIIVA